MADYRVLRSYRSRGSRHRNTVRNRFRNLADVIVGDIEVHHTRLSTRDLRRIAFLAHCSRQREELHPASYVFILDIEHTVLAAYLVASRWVNHLHRLDGRSQAPRIRELQRIG